MKYTISPRRSPRPIISIAFAILLLGPSVARAAECPESSPEDAQERRKLAKEWFSTAESAENAGNDAEATRAYACSYKMVAHPYTAFNLARVAERSGDSELALKMYRAYLTLKPDAQEREKVKGKIKALEDSITGGGAPKSLAEGAATQGSEDGSVTPPPGEGAAAEPTAEATDKKPDEVAPEDLAPPPPEKKPVVVEAKKPPAEPEPEPQELSRVPEWIVGGVTAAALIGGVVYNLAARTKMSACQTDSSNGLQGTASKECDDARPMAYASYALFGVAAAGAALDAVLLIVRRGDSSSNNDSSSVGFMLLPGGGGLAARGRF
jgi:hypothetical protein